MCCDVLGRLQPVHLTSCDELLTIGMTLFKPHVLRHEFGSKSAVEFLQEVHGHAQMLKKLERLHK